MFSGLDREHRSYDFDDLALPGRRGAAPRGDRDRRARSEHGPGHRQVRQAARGEAHGSGGAAAHRDPDRDETLQHPRCVFQVLKRHFARYTPEMVEQVCGVPPDLFAQVCELVTDNSGRDRTTAFVYSVGWTQHTVGVQYIRTAAILQALLGNIGRPGGGILALRGHASIQGSTDIPTLFDLLPGYLPDAARARQRGPRRPTWRPRRTDKGFWANMRALHGQPAEGLVGRRGHGGQRLLLRLPAPADRQPQHLRDRAGPDRRRPARATSCSARTRRSARPTPGCSGSAWPTWTGWWSGTSR